MTKKNDVLNKIANERYKYGFVSKLKSEKIKKGLNEEFIKLISKKRKEPLWLLEYRLSALKKLKKLSSPKWANIKFNLV